MTRSFDPSPKWIDDVENVGHDYEKTVGRPRYDGPGSHRDSSSLIALNGRVQCRTRQQDLPLGRTFKTIGQTITEADVVNFINCTGMVEVLFANLEFPQNDSDSKQRNVSDD